MAPGAAMRQFDLMPDGKRFLVVIPEGGTDSTAPALQINVVLNWLDELKAKAPRP